MSDAENTRAVPGSNSGVAPDLLRNYVARIEELNEEIATSAGDRKEVFAEAKSSGFDPKLIRQVINVRKDSAKWKENQDALEIYLHAMGLI